MDYAAKLEEELKLAQRLHKRGVAPSTCACTYSARSKTAFRVFAEADAALFAGLINDAKLEATKSRLQLQAEALVDGGGLLLPAGSAGARVVSAMSALCRGCPTCNVV